jgi:hypothetical protein
MLVEDAADHGLGHHAAADERHPVLRHCGSMALRMTYPSCPAAERA